MRIACPSCAAEYEVPASRLTPRRMVRCARCGEKWMAVREAEVVPAPEPAPPANETAQPKVPPPALTAMDRLAASPPPAPSRAGLLAAWVLTIFVLVGAMAATVAWRDDVIRIWPASSRILEPIDHQKQKPAQTSGDKAQ
ncbi:MAG: zinc-ribbon domain-containing protein [Rhodopila sp.]|nr:zinc-ribbon domain-containing protein [Rhodopila sp.]